MELEAFSISLAVRDLATSQAIYRKLDFERSGGFASFVIDEPDGNPILVDQTVPRPIAS